MMADVLKLEDLEVGMELYGSVLNVVDFGAFVDIGLQDSGMVHISHFSQSYVRDPHDFVSVGQIVKVWVLELDKTRRRVALTMIQPGTREAPPRRGRRPAAGAVEAAKPADAGGRPQGVPAEGEGSRRQGGGRRPPPSQGDRPPRPAGRREDGPSQGARPSGGRPPAGGGRRPSPAAPTARVYESRPPKQKVPISKDMREGKAPLRTFGDLKQFLETKQEPPPPASDGGTAPEAPSAG